MPDVSRLLNEKTATSGGLEWAFSNGVSLPPDADAHGEVSVSYRELVEFDPLPSPEHSADKETHGTPSQCSNDSAARSFLSAGVDLPTRAASSHCSIGKYARNTFELGKAGPEAIVGRQGADRPTGHAPNRHAQPPMIPIGGALDLDIVERYRRYASAGLVP